MKKLIRSKWAQVVLVASAVVLSFTFGQGFTHEKSEVVEQSAPYVNVTPIPQRSAAPSYAGPVNPVVVREGNEVTDPETLKAFRAKIVAQNPGMDVNSVRATINYVGDLTPRLVATPKTVAIFVRNQSRKANLDDEVDGLRDLISAELAAGDIRLLDPQEIASSFHRYKVTTDEERAGLVEGVFSGGSVTRVAQMVGADYIIAISLNYADIASRNLAGGGLVRTYRTTMPVKVLDGNSGASVFGTVIKQTYPTTGGSRGNDDGYFYDLFERSASEIASSLLASMPRWRTVGPVDSRQVAFTVSSTVDELIKGLELGVRAPNELLAEFRHAVGGVTIELDGASIGSSPGKFVTTPGLHQLRVSRAWMKPWQQTVNIQNGSDFRVALELSTEGMSKFKSMEGFKASTALVYAEAAFRKGVHVDFDTSGWRDVSVGSRGNEINLEKHVQSGMINQSVR